MQVILSLFSHSFDDQGITYFVPDDLQSRIQPGVVVEAPYRDAIQVGVILRVTQDTDHSNLKPIISILEETPLLHPHQITTIFWIASEYFCQIHHALNLFFPKNTKEKIQKQKLLLEATKAYEYTPQISKHLNTEQTRVKEEILRSKDTDILLYGVTGSGKTEVYISLIEHYLKQGKQSLILIPEIILTNQIGERIEAVFGKDICLIHSAITDATKTKYWRDIFTGEAKVIIGTRSALFYPYNNLGVIIMDEEHDPSYISDTAPRYHTREVAKKLTE